MTRKVFVYIAASLDGYIAKHDDDLTFLSLVEQEGEDYGYAEFIDTIDTVIIGRKTYDKVQSMGIEYLRADKEYYIVSRTPRAQEGNVRFHSGDLKALVEELKEKEGKHIFVDGGAEVVGVGVAATGTVGVTVGVGVVAGVDVPVPPTPTISSPIRWGSPFEPRTTAMVSAPSATWAWYGPYRAQPPSGRSPRFVAAVAPSRRKSRAR